MKHSTNSGQGSKKPAVRQNTGRCRTKKAYIALELRGKSQGDTFFSFMQSVIGRLKQLNRVGTAKNYTSAFNSFRHFRRDADIPFDSVNHLLIEEYQVYLSMTGITPNSISFYMRILRAVYNRAVEQRLTVDHQPFRTVFTGIEKTVKRAISINHVRLIIELDLRHSHVLEMARDLFLFLFLCRGMSFIDAAFLKKTDIKNGTLTYRRHKTGRRLYIKVTPQMQELIHPNDSPYLLPVITSPGNNERRQYETALRSTNKSLKTIAEMIKSPVTLTTYVSRHAWASIAKSKNISVNVISDALGHDSIATTQIYLDSIDAAIIDHANEMIIQDLYKK